jgi:hypothetical protein
MAMKNKKINSFFLKYGVQMTMIGVIIAILLVIFLSLINGVNSSDLVIEKDNFIIALLGNSVIGGGFFSFSTTNRLLKFQTSFGITRKKLYRDYVLRIIQVFSWIVGIYLFYATMNIVISGQYQNLIAILLDTKILFLLVLFGMINALGFWCGIKQVKLGLYIAILIIVFIITYLLYILHIENSVVLGGFVIITTGLFLNNYKIIIKGKIR